MSSAASKPIQRRPARATQLGLAIGDYRDGLRLWRLAVTFAWDNVRQRYARTLLGPLWVTLSMAAFIAATGILYGLILGQPTREYLPYFCSGFIAWSFISGVISESVRAFMQWRHFILGSKLPYTFYITTMIVNYAIVFAHNILIYVAVVLIYGVPITGSVLLVLPAFLLLCAAAAAAALLIGIVCARYRDVAEIVSILLQFAFFVTPILWYPSRLGPFEAMVAFNPVYYFVELLRAPLLGQPIDLQTWVGALGLTILVHAVAFALFVRTRARLVFWI